MPIIVEDKSLYTDNETVLSALPSISDPNDILRCLRLLVEESYDDFKSKLKNELNLQIVAIWNFVSSIV